LLFLSGTAPEGNNIDLDVSNNPIPPTIPTKLYISQNRVKNDAVNNTTGNNPGGYQAGISDVGNSDKIIKNNTCGLGYTPVATPPPYLYMIDVTFTNNPILDDNTICGKHNSTSASLSATVHGAAMVNGKFIPANAIY
jgi:hypothetical protein